MKKKNDDETNRYMSVNVKTLRWLKHRSKEKQRSWICLYWEGVWILDAKRKESCERFVQCFVIIIILSRLMICDGLRKWNQRGKEKGLNKNTLMRRKTKKAHKNTGKSMFKRGLEK